MEISGILSAASGELTSIALADNDIWVVFITHETLQLFLELSGQERNREVYAIEVEGREFSLSVLGTQANRVFYLDDESLMARYSIEMTPWFLLLHNGNVECSQTEFPDSFVGKGGPGKETVAEPGQELLGKEDTITETDQEFEDPKTDPEQSDFAPGEEDLGPEIALLQLKLDTYEMELTVCQSEVEDLKYRLTEKDQEIAKLHKSIEDKKRRGTVNQFPALKINNPKVLKRVSKVKEEDINFWRIAEDQNSQGKTMHFDEIAKTKDLWITNIEKATTLPTHVYQTNKSGENKLNFEQQRRAQVIRALPNQRSPRGKEFNSYAKRK